MKTDKDMAKEFVDELLNTIDGKNIKRGWGALSEKSKKQIKDKWVSFLLSEMEARKRTS